MQFARPITSTGDNFSHYAYTYTGQGEVASVDNAGTPGVPDVLLNSGYVSSPSRRRHRESDVWQRRFWEHTLDDIEDFVLPLFYAPDAKRTAGRLNCYFCLSASKVARTISRRSSGSSVETEAS